MIKKNKLQKRRQKLLVTTFIDQGTGFIRKNEWVNYDFVILEAVNLNVKIIQELVQNFRKK